MLLENFKGQQSNCLQCCLTKYFEAYLIGFVLRKASANKNLLFHMTAGLYALFLKEQGHQGIFSLVKGTLRENCKYLLEHFRGTKAMIMGGRQSPLLPSYQACDCFLQSFSYNLVFISLAVLQDATKILSVYRTAKQIESSEMGRSVSTLIIKFHIIIIPAQPD